MSIDDERATHDINTSWLVRKIGTGTVKPTVYLKGCPLHDHNSPFCLHDIRGSNRDIIYDHQFILVIPHIVGSLHFRRVEDHK